MDEAEKVLFSDEAVEVICRDEFPIKDDLICQAPSLVDLRRDMAQLQAKLENTLSDEQWRAYDDLQDYLSEYRAMRDRELFIYAFKVGSRVTQHLLSDLRQ